MSGSFDYSKLKVKDIEDAKQKVSEKLAKLVDITLGDNEVSKLIEPGIKNYEILLYALDYVHRYGWRVPGLDMPEYNLGVILLVKRKEFIPLYTTIASWDGENWRDERGIIQDDVLAWTHIP